MKVVADMNIYPMGTADKSIAPHIVDCVTHLEQKGLKTNVHAAGTNMEGDLDTVLAAIKECMQLVLDKGVPRLDASVRLICRSDKQVAIDDMISSVQTKMHTPPASATASPSQSQSQHSQAQQRYELRH